jgi:hypothetical protein
MAYRVVVPRRQQDGTIATVTFNIRVKDPLGSPHQTSKIVR